jgi:hypothetical protein
VIQTEHLGPVSLRLRAPLSSTFHTKLGASFPPKHFSETGPWWDLFNKSWNTIAVCLDTLWLVHILPLELVALDGGTTVNLHPMHKELFLTLGKFMRPLRKLLALMSLRASDQDGLGQGLSGSVDTGSTRRWNSSSTQSMMRMIRWGGLASLRTGKGKGIKVTLRLTGSSGDIGVSIDTHNKCLTLGVWV